MKWITSASLATLAMTSCLLAAVYLSLTGTRTPPAGFQKLQHVARDANAQGVLQTHRMFYLVNVTVGTPPQPVLLDIDTGSRDTWVQYANSPLCKAGACTASFDPHKSSSFKLLRPGIFHPGYVDGSGTIGDFITEDLTFGKDTIKALQIGPSKTMPMFGE